MIKKIFFLLILCFMAAPVIADTVYPAGARYVIINPNNSIKASSTFLLDTKTGKVWHYVEDANGYLFWEQMEYDWYKQDGSRGGLTKKPPILTSP